MWASRKARGVDARNLLDMTTIELTSAAARRPERRSSALTALMLVQIVVGYEWLASGLSKLANGNFVGGLAAELADLGRDSSPWYGHFLRTAIVPHSVAFGYAIELAELLAGLALLGVAVAELAARSRLSERLRLGLRWLAVAALGAGIVLAANFELASGGSFGLRLAADSFDEGVDLDTIMVAAQLALIVAFVPGLRRSARRR